MIAFGLRILGCWRIHAGLGALCWGWGYCFVAADRWIERICFAGSGVCSVGSDIHCPHSGRTLGRNCLSSNSTQVSSHPGVLIPHSFSSSTIHLNAKSYDPDYVTNSCRSIHRLIDCTAPRSRSSEIALPFD